MSKRLGQNATYELLLTLGADMSVARTTVAECFLIKSFARQASICAPGDVLDLRSHGCGKMWDFPNAADRIKAREKVISEKPCIIMRVVLGPLANLALGGIGDAKSRTKSC